MVKDCVYRIMEVQRPVPLNLEVKERLKMHMKGHFGQLKHKCDISSKAFWIQRRFRRTHRQALTQTRSYIIVEYVATFFSYKRSLRLHLKAVHNTNWRGRSKLLVP